MPNKRLSLACREIADWWCVMRIGNDPVLEYGASGEFFAIFPAAGLSSHPIAFARASKRAYARLKGCGLRVRWPEHEPQVVKWIEWLGVRHEGDWAVL